MQLEPRVRRLVDLANPLDDRPPGSTIVQRRIEIGALTRRFSRLAIQKTKAPVTQHDVLVPVDGGQITVRVYRPANDGRLPLHVFLHGGGWCLGNLDERDRRCQAIAAGAGCVVASVDYRMAPENRYPTAPEDCYAALVWLVETAGSLHLDPKRISVGGESAGGNLAAVLCLMARDRSGPAIAYQWLDVPVTDLTLSQPSMRSTPSGYLLDHDDMVEFRDHYLAEPGQQTEPYASPLLAPDLRGLPPAWILTCGADPLRDDGQAYADALSAAGIPVQHTHLAGHVHPSTVLTRLIPSAASYERDAIAALRLALRAP